MSRLGRNERWDFQKAAFATLPPPHDPKQGAHSWAGSYTPLGIRLWEERENPQ